MKQSVNKPPTTLNSFYCPGQRLSQITFAASCLSARGWKPIMIMQKNEVTSQKLAWEQKKEEKEKKVLLSSQEEKTLSCQSFQRPESLKTEYCSQ